MSNHKIQCYFWLCLTVLVSCGKLAAETNLFLPPPQPHFLLVGTNMDNPTLASTYTVNTAGEIKLVHNLPFWNGFPFLPHQELVLENALAQPTAILFNAATGEERPMTLFTQPYELFAHPTAGVVAYTLFESGVNQLHFYFVETQEDKIVKSLSGKFDLFGWSPDGQELYFLWLNAETSQYDVYSLNYNSFELKQLTNNQDIEVVFIPSPTQKLFLVGTIPIEDEYFFENYRNYLLADSFYLSNFTATPTFFDEGIYTASWSSDGQKIAVSREGNLCFLEVVTLTWQCPLAKFLPLKDYRLASVYPVSWSSDNQVVAFQAINQTTGCQEIYLFNLPETRIIEPEIQTCLGSPLFAFDVH